MFGLSKRGEPIASGADGRPPRGEGGRVAKEIFFAMEVVCGDEVWMGRRRRDGEGQREMGVEGFEGRDAHFQGAGGRDSHGQFIDRHL